MPEKNETARARLALADGSVWMGAAFGATGRGVVTTAEVVFNTAMTGYQEALTDPSYTGQILVMTTPIVGIYGVNPEDVESTRVQVSGFVVHELSRRTSNYRATSGLSDYLADAGVLGLAGVDTRAITRRLRIEGAMQGVLTDDASVADEALVERARSAASMAGRNLVPEVACGSASAWEEPLGAWATLAPTGKAEAGGAPMRVFAMDCGAKWNILRNLTERGCEVTVIPPDTTAERILGAYASGEINGLFISNGPGDPAAVESVIGTLRGVLAAPAGKQPPTFGICLGHQLLALAIGASTYKLKFGHRGVNQPVGSTLTGRVEITSQNHGFAVEPDSLKKAGAEATHTNLNDGTVAGFRLPDRPVFAVQHHPEASPGPHDSGYLFDLFVRMMRERTPPALAEVGSSAGSSAGAGGG